MRPVFLLLAATVLLGFAAGTARAQVQTDTLTAPLLPNRSPFEDGWLNRMTLDREPVGGRSRAMGGTGLAMPGGPTSQMYNPAAILGIKGVELSAEGTMYGGGATVNAYPESIEVAPGLDVEASDPRVTGRGGFSYNGLFLGMPVTLLGGRGAVALSYRRVALTGFKDESRTTLQGSITNQAEATYGIGDSPKDGLDAISLSVARDFMNRLGVGVNLNFQSGTLNRGGSTGITVVGNQVGQGNVSYKQDVSSFNVDAGALLDLGRLRLGGSVYLGHDLDFEVGAVRQTTLPAPPDFQSRSLILLNPTAATLSVPTMFGVGASYDITDRLTVAADFLFRPWNDAEFTRTRMEPFIGFGDVTDSTTYFQIVIPADNDSLWRQIAPAIPDPDVKTETVNAGFSDTHSFRVGLQYFLKKSETFELPIRVGFRREHFTYNSAQAPTLTLNDASLGPDSTGVITGDNAYLEAVYAYRRALEADPGCNTGDCKALGGFLAAVAENSHRIFQGVPADATTFTFGIGTRISEWGADLTFERTSFDYDQFFLGQFDPNLSPSTAISRESRSMFNISFSMTMFF